MNFEKLYIPVKLAGLAVKAKSCIEDEKRTPGERFFRIPESYLIELLIAAGAISLEDVSKMNAARGENEWAVRERIQGDENQGVDMHPPQGLLEEWQKNDQNLIRTIMAYKKTSLKAVAQRYGGNSAAANLANFLAKSDAELASMRETTMRRLAAALQCPYQWLRPLKGGNPLQDDNQEG